MAEQPTKPTPAAAGNADAEIMYLQEKAGAEHTDAPAADEVKGGMGINRIVVTTGKIEP